MLKKSCCLWGRHRNALSLITAAVVMSSASPVLARPATVASTDVPLSIPDANAGGISSSLDFNIPFFDVSDVNLIIDALPHTCVPDLEIELTSPEGTTVKVLDSYNDSGLFTGLGCPDNFSGTVLDDDAVTNLGSGSAPFTGSFNVEHASVVSMPLASFVGEDAFGTWTLTVRDEAGGDVGTLMGWSLEVDGVRGCSAVDNGDGTYSIYCGEGSVTVSDGMDGMNGADGSSCSVTDNGDGTATLECEDGSTVVIADGVDGADGVNGADGSSCSVADNGDGTATLSCEDGSSVTIADGMDGADGPPCSVVDNGDGTSTISCGDGTTTTISNGADGADGADGMDGAHGSSCSVTQNDDGSATIDCEDGSSATVVGGEGKNGSDGMDGMDGGSCTVADNEDGTATLSCDDGTSVTLRTKAAGGGCTVASSRSASPVGGLLLFSLLFLYQRRRRC